jgi:arsenate reductase (thioredoxin)
MRNVLFLCTGNSARSILAEAYLNAAGKDRFTAYSAGSHPVERVHPYAIELLQKNRIDTSGLRSKSWDEFKGPNAPRFDFVFTVCGNAALEACPVWLGQPLRVHWGIDDPAVEGSEAERRKAFFPRLQRAHDAHFALPQPTDGETGPSRAAEAARRHRQGGHRGPSRLASYRVVRPMGLPTPACYRRTLGCRAALRNEVSGYVGRAGRARKKTT